MLMAQSKVLLKMKQGMASPAGMTVSDVFQMIFLFRAFSRAFHDPLGAAVESLVLLKYENASSLCLSGLILHRSRELLNKSVYMLASVATAMKNKKQRFTNQSICFALQFTVFLPITMFVLLASVVLDTALVPFLGFAVFTIGYPKP